MLSGISFSLNSFDNCTGKSYPNNDRFIKSHQSFLDLDTALEFPSKKNSKKMPTENDENSFFSNVLKNNLQPKQNFSSLNDLSLLSENSIMVPNITSKNKRVLDKNPFKVLDAPYLQDDYYVNVVDWSVNDNLAVGLASSVYIWNFENNKVQQLTHYDDYNIPTGITWDLKSERLAIGTMNGVVECWDACKKKIIRTFRDHSERVGALSLIENYFITGSRDRNIIFYDLRCPSRPINIYKTHK